MTDDAARFTINLRYFKYLNVVHPGVDYYLNRIRRRASFTFVKPTHGVWDRLVDPTEAVRRDLVVGLPQFKERMQSSLYNHARTRSAVNVNNVANGGRHQFLGAVRAEE